MATSGSTDYSVDRDDILQQVAEKLKIIEIGGTLAAAHVTVLVAILNQFAKTVPGLKIWKTEWTQKTFSAASEVTGTDSNVYTCILSHTSAANNKPITGANYTTYWKQTGDTGGTWVTSTAYASTGDFTDSASFLGISKAFLKDGETSTPVEIIATKEFMEISNKGDIGDPINLWYNKNSGKIHTWPQLEDTDKVLHYLRRLRIEDFDAGADNPDFPIEWVNSLVYGTARDALTHYAVDENRQRLIINRAKYYIAQANSTDYEESEEVQIFPDLEGYY
jgi:hypothetical protein